jgi:hypothetical protein
MSHITWTRAAKCPGGAYARRYRSFNSNPAVLRVFFHRLRPDPDFSRHDIASRIAMSTLISALPASRDFVTQLFTSLPSLPRSEAEAEASPLSDAPEWVKKQLLSLQVLFPNEFLPALDLLDRRLVSRLRIGIEESGEPTATDNPTASTPDVQMQEQNSSLNDTALPALPGDLSSSRDSSASIDTIHYVRSAQQRSSRFGTSYDSSTSYEVRLRAWNCTCPAFAFAAFPSVHPEPPVPEYVPPDTNGKMDSEASDEEDWMAGSGWNFGGVSLGEGMPPVCKHLLACVLAEQCGSLFGPCVEERRVSVETAAGWAAGWGDV